jgi:hypothetical protein
MKKNTSETKSPPKGKGHMDNIGNIKGKNYQSYSYQKY